MRVLIAVATLLSMAGCTIYSDPNNSASSSFTTDGKMLTEWCTTSELSAACLFYISGVLDGANVQAEVTEKPLPFCPPKDLKYGQAIEITTNYLNKYPQYQSKQASLLIMFALLEAFPCKN